MKLEAKNLGFCIKLFNYVILFAQATFNVSAGYMPVHTVFSFTQCYYILNKLYTLLNIKFYHGIDSSGVTVLIKESLLISKSFVVLNVLAAIILYHVINTSQSDAK